MNGGRGTEATKRLFRVTGIALSFYVALVAIMFFRQRSLLYFPTHVDPAESRLAPWRHAERTIGYCREVRQPRTIWLMMHGNAGQASDRDYVLRLVSEEDSIYVLEYPGYGSREGKPCFESFNQAAAEAYRILRSKNPSTPVSLLGESIGSGPACSLAQKETPPDKIVLVVPFDSLQSVVSKRFYFLPVRLLLLDRWDNVDALRAYAGPIEIFGAVGDEIIPIEHAKTLASQVSGARFTPIAGGHNDWAFGDKVKIR